MWERAFGIGEGDRELLERLIREQLPQATVVERETWRNPEDPSRMVRRFRLEIPRFRGPNGNVANVRTNWALEPGGDIPFLTSAFPKRAPQRRR